MLGTRRPWFRSLCVGLAYLLYFDTLSMSALSSVPRRAGAFEAAPEAPPLAEPARPSAASGFLYVDASDPTCGGNAPCFQTIQSAIDAAGPGDRVRIRPGRYPEQLVVEDKNDSETASESDRIVIEADPSFSAGGVVVGPAGDGCPIGYFAVFERSSFVTLRGLVFRNAGRRGMRLRGRPRANRAIHIVQNRIFADRKPLCSGGIEISHLNEDIVVANNLIYGTRRDAVHVTDNGTGPHFIVSNTLVGNGHTGIYLARSNEAWVVNNLVLGNGTGRGGQRYGIRQGRRFPRSEKLHVQGNLVCGNAKGEFKKVELGDDDTGNLTPTGTEGPGVRAAAGCDDPATVLANLAGADGILDTADDDFHLAAGSPAIDAGVALVAALPEVPAALLQADHFGEGARPADGNGDGRADYDIGAIEGEGPGGPTPSPAPTPTPAGTATPVPTLSPSPTPISTPTSEPTPRPTPTPEPTPSPTPSPSPTPVNHAPRILTTPPTAGGESQSYQYDVDAADPEGETVSFALAAAPAGMGIDPSTGLITWTPTAGDAGPHDVVVRASDPPGLSAFQSFTVEVASVPAPPVAVDDAYEARVGESLVVPAAGVLENDTDPNDDALTAMKLSDPSYGTLDFASDGSFTYTPTEPTFTRVYTVQTATDANLSLADPMPKLVISTPVYPGYPPVNAVDGRLDTSWFASQATAEVSYEQRFTYDVTVKEVRLFSARNVPNGHDFRSGAVQLLDADGNPLFDSGTIAFPDVTLPADQRDVTVDLVALTGAPVAGVRTVRFASTDYEGSTPGLAGLHVIGDGTVHQSNLATEQTFGPPVTDGPTGASFGVADLDGDGFSDIVAPTNSAGIGNTRWTAYSGDGGPTLWRIPVFPFNTGLADPAQLYISTDWSTLADIDGDGRPEFLVPASSANQTLVELVAAFEHDGTFKWVSESIDTTGVGAGLRAVAPAVADLDGDGDVEIVVGYVSNRITIFDHDGHVVAHATGAGNTGSYTNAPDQQPIVADIDLDGRPEILYGDDVYGPDGSLLWSADLSGLNVPVQASPVNLDDDPQAEVVLAGRFGALAAVEHDGTFKWLVPGAMSGGARFAVADVDGDGRPNILVTGATDVCSFDSEGTLLWCTPHQLSTAEDPFAGKTAPTAFDFDGDGIMEVVFRGHYDLIFYDGRDGTLLLAVPMTTSFIDLQNETAPLIVDTDGDGQAEIVVPESSDFYARHVLVLGAATGGWQATRPIWNTPGYHITNVNPDGTVPSPAPVNWLTPGLNDFRVNVPLPEERIGRFDSFTYKANDGGFDSNDATVHLEVLPPGNPPQILSQPPLSGTVGFPYAYPVLAFDQDVGDVLTYALSSAPSGMTIDPSTGQVAWTPAPGDEGDHAIGITVADTLGFTAFQGYTLDVATPTTVPDVVGHPQATAETEITAASLAVGAVSTAGDAVVPAGAVVSQSPPAGTIAEIGAPVALVVSTGPAPTQIDDDGDGFTEEQGDCDDTNPSIFPGAPDPNDDGIDQNCDGIDGAKTIAEIVVEPGSPVSLVGAKVAFTATAVFDDGTSQDVTAVAAWQSLAPATASVDPTGLGTALAAGGATIRATVRGTSSDAIWQISALTPGDTAPPIAEITSPTGGATVTAPVDVLGTATDANLLKYEISVAPAGESDFDLIHTSTTSVSGGVLGRFDPSLLVNDLYTLRLRVYDTGGNVTTAEVVVQVDGSLKAGSFALTFKDLDVPVSGIPIQVLRTYDSRDKGQGDFGVGWRLDIQSLRLRTNRPLATGWRLFRSSFFHQLQPSDAHKVSLTLEDGRVEEFDLMLSRTQAVSPGFDAFATFAPRPGTRGSLALDEDNLVNVVGTGVSGEQIQILNHDLSRPFAPQRFRYTRLDGTEIVIVRGSGVESIRDTNGNTLTFGPGGITHSSGKSIVFARDAEGRITSVTDPKGNVQTYGYDEAGDLRTHTDATGQTTRFLYDRMHRLIETHDPLGHTAVRRDYDADGRLISVTDAAGNSTTLHHDLDGREEVVTDRLGRSTIHHYDDRGNVLTSTDPAGNTTTFSYDGRDNLLSETDPLGNTTSFGYDGVGNLTSITDALGSTTTLTRGARGEIPTVKDARGGVVTSTYDSRGNLVTQSDALGNVVQIAYDGAGNRTAIVDAAGDVWQNGYDGRGLRTSLLGPDGTGFSFAHDPNGNLISQADASGTTWALSYDRSGRVTGVDLSGAAQSLSYDALGRVVSGVDPTGRAITIDYDALGEPARIIRTDGQATIDQVRDGEGNVIAQTDALGNVTTYEYDALDRLVLTTHPDGSAERRSYDAAGRLIQEVDQLGRVTRHGYDAIGRRTRTVDALGGETGWEYDVLGNVTATTDPLGRRTEYGYDALNRLVETRFPDGGVEQRRYDVRSFLVEVIDPAGGSKRFEYEPDGQLAAVTDELGAVTRYAYDESGRLVTVTDANGHATSFAYDGQGRRIATVDPLGHADTLTLDEAGRPLTSTNGDGETVTYQYDARGWLTQVELPDGSLQAFTYTADGLPDSATDAEGTVRLDYDPQTRRLLRVTEPDGRYVRYEYDAAGNRIVVAHAAAAAGPEAVVRYAYDALNRVVEMTDPAGGVTSYGYDAAGNLTSIDRPNGSRTTHSYDDRDRLLDVVHSGPGGGVLERFSYTLDALGNRTAIGRAGGSRDEYDYDAASRVMAERHFDSSGTNVADASYEYDAVGNVVQRGGSLGSVSLSYDAANQLAAAGDTAYSYDGAGNLVRATSPSGDVTSYDYDALGRLVRFDPPMAPPTFYTYDVDGVRQRKSGPGGTFQFLVDRSNLTGFAQVVRRQGAGDDALSVYGPEGLAQLEDGSVRYVHGDGLGSTRLLTDGSGSETASYDYSAYGELLPGSAAGSTSHLFAGEQRDQESGLYYLRARYYDPGLGRFLSRDPAPGDPRRPPSFHGYLYADANPVRYTDPSGLFTLTELMVSLNNNVRQLANRVDHLRRAKDTGEKAAGTSAQVLGAAYTVLAVAGAEANPGPFLQYLGHDPLTVKAAEVELVGLAVDMLTRKVEYEALMDTKRFSNLCAWRNNPAGERAVVDLALAENRQFARTGRITLCAYFFKSPPLPVPSLTSSMVGTIIHEFAHILFRVRDLVYYCGPASALLGPLALLNADNYRCAVAASTAGLASPRPPFL